MGFARLCKLAGIMVFAISCAALATQENPEYCTWKAQNFAIAAALCGLVGDPLRGRAFAVDSHAGNCLACHQMSVPEHPFHGTVGPSFETPAVRF